MLDLKSIPSASRVAPKVDALPKKSFLGRLTGNLVKAPGQLAGGLYQGFEGLGAGIASGVESAQNRGGTEVAGTLERSSRGQDILSTGVQLVGDLAGAAGDVVAGGAMGLVGGIGKASGVNQDASQALSKIAQTPIGKMGVEALNGGLERWQEFKLNNPVIANNIEGVVNIASIGVVGKGGKLAKEGIDNLVTRGITSQAPVNTADFLSVPKKQPIRSLREVFGKKKGVITEITPTTDIARASGIAATETEKALLDPSLGRTKESQGLISKLVDTDNELLSVADKRVLLEADPNIYKKYKGVLENTARDAKAPTLHEVGIKDFEGILKEYKAANKEAGEQIGKIRDGLASTKLKGTQEIDDVIGRFSTSMAKNNVEISGNKVKITGNSPFKGSEKALQEVAEILENIKSSESMNELLLGMKQLDNKIIFGKGDDVSQSLQGIAKTIRNDLKSVRNKYMSPEDLAAYEKYSDTIEFINDFSKGNIENKLSVLLNSAGSMRSFKLKKVADEIKRVTGKDIQDIGLLINTFMKNLPSTDRNVSRLTQILGKNIPLSTYGIATASGDIAKNVLQKILGTDLLKEMDKAGLAKIGESYKKLKKKGFFGEMKNSGAVQIDKILPGAKLLDKTDDVLYEFKNFKSAYADGYKGRDEVLEAIDDIGGVKNVERAVQSINKLAPTEDFSPSNSGVQRAMKEIQNGDRIPLIVDEFGDIYDGNHRYAAYKALKIDDIPTIRPKTIQPQVQKNVVKRPASATQDQITKAEEIFSKANKSAP